jgi:hypothetical protein
MKRIFDTTTGQFSASYPRADDEPVQGLETHLQIYEVIEIPQPEITATQYLTRTETADHTSKTLTLGWQIHDIPAPPVIVPFRSLAFALLQAGLYEQVEAAALATLEGKIWWQTAQSTTVQRDHPFVIALAQAISQTPEQIDAIFAAAAQL